VSRSQDATALGVAALARLGAGERTTLAEAVGQAEVEWVAEPAITPDQAAERLSVHNSAVAAVLAPRGAAPRGTGPGEPGGPLPAEVAVIGAGVVGTAITRALALQDVSCVLIDAAYDVGTGTSKANTAILHTGFDAIPGSLESRLLRRGYELLG